MLRKLTIAAALLAGFCAMPAHASGTAADGIADMAKWNLIVLGDWQAAHDVEGRAIVVGNATGGSVTVGLGRTKAGQSATPALNDPTLVIGGNNLIGNLNVNNGSNGGLGNIANGPSVWIKGDSGNIAANLSTSINENAPGPRSLLVGGYLKGTFNNFESAQIGGNFYGGDLNPVSTGSIKLGGTKQSGNMNLNGASFQNNLGASFKAGLENAVDGMTSTLSSDLTALSSTLSGLTLGSNPSFKSSGGGGQTLVLNAIQGSNGFSLINLTQADLLGYSSIAYNFTPDAGPVIINFTGNTLTSGPNVGKVEATLGLNFVQLKDANQNPLTDDFRAVNQSVIWNFGNADFVNFSTEFFGSVLAVNGKVTNNNAINGSLVAKTFAQGGEVHLGTLDAFALPPPPPPAVPEPATWAMMIGGFALAGAGLRRRRAAARFA